MSRHLSLFLCLALIIIPAWSMAGNALESRETVNVGRVHFEGIALDNAVRLEWNAETELGPVDSSLPAPGAQDAETSTPGGSPAGRIYLWAAFIAALVIFVAAVIGAILIYTRQRSKE